MCSFPTLVSFASYFDNSAYSELEKLHTLLCLRHKPDSLMIWEVISRAEGRKVNRLGRKYSRKVTLMAMDSPSFSVAPGLINANWHCGASPLYFRIFWRISLFPYFGFIFGLACCDSVIHWA